MKIIKRIGIFLLLFLLTGLIVGGWVYRYLIMYKTIGERLPYAVKEPVLLQYISSNDHLQEPEVNDIIILSLKLTSKRLHFTNGINSKDPNELILSNSANCIGYAAFFSTVCNKLLEKHNLKGEWIAKPQIGQLYCFGTNIHPYFKSTFFKDHDFVIIENKNTDRFMAVDPSLYDYTRIQYVKFQQINF
jgi:hypothetical protein